MITIAKTKDFNSIRKVSEFITDKKVVNELFDNVSVRFNERNGGCQFHRRFFKVFHDQDY